MVLSVALTVVGGVLLAVRVPAFSEPVILHVDPLIGVDRVGSIWEAVGIFGIGLIMVAVHMLLAAEFLERIPLLAYVSAAAGAFTALLLLISTAYIVSLN